MVSSSPLFHAPTQPATLVVLLPVPPSTWASPQPFSPHPQEPRKSATGSAVDAEATRPAWAAALPPRLPRGRTSSCAGNSDAPFQRERRGAGTPRLSGSQCDVHSLPPGGARSRGAMRILHRSQPAYAGSGVGRGRGPRRPWQRRASAPAAPAGTSTDLTFLSRDL